MQLYMISLRLSDSGSAMFTCDRKLAMLAAWYVVKQLLANVFTTEHSDVAGVIVLASVSVFGKPATEWKDNLLAMVFVDRLGT